MKTNVTIKDVAKKAGVSISTVSRVINDSKPVTDEVKQKVLDVIKETGYVPNPLARSLVTKKSQLIGVIVPEVSDSFVSELVNGIEEVAKMYDYDILLANTYSNKEQELKSINLLRAKQVEGMEAILDLILEEIPEPKVEEEGSFLFQPALLDYNDFVGRIGIGVIKRGKLKVNDQVMCMRLDGTKKQFKVLKL